MCKTYEAKETDQTSAHWKTPNFSKDIDFKLIEMKENGLKKFTPCPRQRVSICRKTAKKRTKGQIWNILEAPKKILEDFGTSI